MGAAHFLRTPLGWVGLDAARLLSNPTSARFFFMSVVGKRRERQQHDEPRTSCNLELCALWPDGSQQGGQCGKQDEP
jgi:hypothetical protein